MAVRRQRGALRERHRVRHRRRAGRPAGAGGRDGRGDPDAGRQREADHEGDRRARGATVVFNAVSTTVSAKGTEEKAPQTDEEWEAVGNSAAALIESGNLLLMGSRAVDKGDWVKMSQALIEAGKVALKATQAKSADQLLASGEGVNNRAIICDACHSKYQRGS